MSEAIKIGDKVQIVAFWKSNMPKVAGVYEKDHQGHPLVKLEDGNRVIVMDTSHMEKI